MTKTQEKFKSLTQGQKNILMADQMFKDAFLVKKTRFSKLHPDLSDEELHQMTVDYFKDLGKRAP